jgi:hypothetical protein
MHQKEKKEILKLLKLIRKYVENQRDIDSPTRFAYIDTYLEEYSKDRIKITWKTFDNCHDHKKDETDPKNRVRSYFDGEFRPFLDMFFRTEGRKLPNRIAIPTPGYYLKLVPNEFASIRRKNTSESIDNQEKSQGVIPDLSFLSTTPNELSITERQENATEIVNQNSKARSESVPGDVAHTLFPESLIYEERRYLGPLKYHPLLYAVIAIFVIMIFFFFVSVYFTLPLIIYKKLTISLFLIEIALAFLVGLFFITGLRLSQLSQGRRHVHFFSDFFYRYYFLGVRDSKAILASYSSRCPLCGGIVKLVNRKAKWRGYVGECQEYPEGHVFSFDFISLKGERLK